MSPKELAVLDEISKMKEDEKAVLFSQWTSMLDIVQGLLERNGFAWARIDGTMSADERIKAMKAFESDEEGSPRFILCSLRACGTGISLTRGNVCLLLDCWWNFAVEAVRKIGDFA